MVQRHFYALDEIDHLQEDVRKKNHGEVNLWLTLLLVMYDWFFFPDLWFITLLFILWTQWLVKLCTTLLHADALD